MKSPRLKLPLIAQKPFRALHLAAKARRLGRRVRSASRLARYGMLAILLLGITLSLAGWRYAHRYNYRLNPRIAALIGPADKAVFQKVKYQNSSRAWVLAAPASKTPAPGSVTIGTPKGESPFGFTLPKQLGQGISVTDPQTSLAMTMVPADASGAGRQEGQHFVYPLAAGGAQAVYTVKHNGLLGEIVLPHGSQQAISFGYRLKLPGTLAARMLPDGSLGIYSADPILFGHITGDSQDQTLLAKGKTSAPKNHLVFVVPLPAIQDTHGRSTSAKAAFSLKGSRLTVSITNTAGVHGPLLVDPSVVVTSASVLADGNNEGDVGCLGTNYICEGGLTGGAPGAWTQITSGTGALQTATYDLAATAYNGYVYTIGGYGTGGLATVEYSQIQSNGAPGAWTQITSGTGALQTATYDLAAVAYNGYLYAIGGYNGTGAIATVEYAAIGSNGAPGAWTQITSGTGALQTATFNFAATAYNGYLYAIGGNNGIGPLATVEYSQIQSNGAPGAWTQITSGTGALQTAAYDVSGVAYNGYLYAIGGTTGSSTLATVEYSQIQSNGAPGAWTQITSGTGALQTATYQLAATAYNGYIYATGGINSLATVQYSQIQANGAPGAWTQITSGTGALQTGVDQHASVAYNGYLYAIGGNTGSSATTTVEYSQVEPAGFWGPVTDIASGTGALALAVYQNAAVAYNGYLYSIGGYKTGSKSAAVVDVQYAAIGANGAPGAWTDVSRGTGALQTATYDLAATASNGYLYAIGGYAPGVTATVEYSQIGANGAPGAWTQITSGTGALQTATGAEGATASNGYLYAIGGVSGSNLATVEYSQIQSNGAPGAWTQITSGTGALQTATQAPGATAYNGYLYAIGGDSSSYLATVEYSQIQSNGAPGAWTSITSGTGALQYPTYGQGVAVYNGYLYSIGGETTGVTATVEYAPIQSNGAPGAWTQITSGTGALQTATYSQGVAVYNGYLYSIGGTNNGTGAIADVEWGAINNGGPGAPGAWTSITSGTGALQTAAYGLAATAYNGYLYAIGGYNGAPLATVEYAAIQSNGAPGAWTSITSGTGALQTAAYYLAATAYNGYLYAIGGYTGSISVLATVEYSQIQSNGAPGAWIQSTSGTGALQTGSDYLGATAYNGYLYAIGGYTGSTALATVEYSQIGANGAPGAWTQITSGTGALQTAASGVAATAYNGYLYAIGGTINNGSTALATVEYSQIQSNGAPGAWTSITSGTGALQTATEYLGATAYNGYLYAIGGASTSPTATVEYAPIQSNGAPGAWTSITSGTGALQTGSDYLGATVYNGYLYAIGGNTSSPIATVEYAPLQTIPRIGVYSRLIDITGYANADAQPVALAVQGTDTGNPGIGSAGVGGLQVQYQFASNACASFNTQKAVQNTGGNLLSLPFAVTYTTNGCGAATNLGRYVFVRFLLDDSLTATFPDVDGNHTSISSITLYSHPATNHRLRGGATFGSNSLQSLDAPPTAK